MAESQRKFDAAVHVIRSLPKSGSFQPSHEMMLKFYGYYKQAKEGPCNETKPSFWDVVKKAKWEAWSKLGDTSREEAMENYVHELKQVIKSMPETDQASQFITALEPFYKVAYKKEEKAPPIFNIFQKKHHSTQVNKLNGDIPSHIKENGTNSDEHILDTSHASAIHNITHSTVKHTSGQSNGDCIRTENLPHNEKVNKKEHDSSSDDVISSQGISNDAVLNGHSNDLQDCDNGNKVEDNNDKNDEDESDEDELFCDSLGPEFLEQQLDQGQMVDSRLVESVREDIVLLNDRNLSSFSDVEILEQFELKKNRGSGEDSSSSLHSDKMVHVHFEDLNTSREDNTVNDKVSKESVDKECMVQPHQHGVDKECMVQPHQHGVGTGGGDSRGLLRATASDRKHAQRTAVQHSERSPRYGQRYRRSQESDSDESPDHNSSSERDDVAIDGIANLLLELQDNMKKILDRLKRLEATIQQNQTSWFENYRPSKTFVFLIIWPIIVNFLFKFLRRRFSKKKEL